ncbi:hypothetical protein [Lacinutrix chionoecetis]
MKYPLILLFTLFSFSIFAQNNDKALLKVTRYKLHPTELNIQNDVDAEKVNLKIYYLKEGNITEDYRFFKPKKNEILFFYGIDSESKTTQMFFKLHDNLKKAYKKKNFEKFIKLIEVLEYNVFPTEVDFSGMEAYAALERI